MTVMIVKNKHMPEELDQHICMLIERAFGKEEPRETMGQYFHVSSWPKSGITTTFQVWIMSGTWL